MTQLRGKKKLVKIMRKMRRLYFTDHGIGGEGGVAPRFSEEHLFTSLVFTLVIKTGQRTERGRNLFIEQTALAVEVKGMKLKNTWKITTPTSQKACNQL